VGAGVAALHMIVSMYKMISRSSARVLLIDHVDQLLLYRGLLPQVEAPFYAWFTPGGAIDPGETGSSNLIGV
jgi:8-oxo-dGTP pyrophosphatase MutT (NUDIX family)